MAIPISSCQNGAWQRLNQSAPRTLPGTGRSRRACARVPAMRFDWHPGFGHGRNDSFLPPNRGRRSAEGRIQPDAAPRSRMSPSESASGAAAVFGDRSPFGAPPRRSPYQTYPVSAQLQTRASRDRPGGSFARCRLSLVNRAPRRPVIVPVGRCPGAARERGAKPPAGCRTRSVPRCASRTRPSNDERDSPPLYHKQGHRVKENVTGPKRRSAAQASPARTGNYSPR